MSRSKPTSRRTRHEARLPQTGRPGASAASSAFPDDITPAQQNGAVQEDLRCRLSCAGKLVRDVFGFDHHDDPSLVTRDAYLIVVSRIIEAITADKKNLSTTALVALSKALAEHRRLNTVQLEIERRFPEKAPRDDAPAPDSDRPLPAGFSRVVEQIYGTNLSSPSDTSPPSPDAPTEDPPSECERP